MSSLRTELLAPLDRRRRRQLTLVLCRLVWTVGVDTAGMKVTNIVVVEVAGTAGVELVNTIRVELLTNMLVLAETVYDKVAGWGTPLLGWLRLL